MKKNYLNIFLGIFAMLFLATSCNQDENPGIDENTGNNELAKKYVFAIKSDKQTKAASFDGTTWDTGTTITVKFISGGSNYAKQKVEEYANEWARYANINFEFVSSSAKADVKIAFNYDDSSVAWSYIGRLCTRVSQSRPSMNIPYYNDNDVNSEEFRAVVLREFGHVLGLVFEHQSPNAYEQFSWDIDKVYTYFRQQGWTEDEIYDLIYTYYYPDEATATAYDEESIMLLYFPDFLTTNNKETRWNTTLSEMDKLYISELYPGRTYSSIPDRMTINIELWGETYAYTSVRIGEYLWMNSNFTAPALTPKLTQHQINRNFWLLGIDTLNYIVTPDDIDKYVGQYYANGTRLYDMKGKVFEVRDQGLIEKEWGLPSKKDFRQLYAMCGNATANEVLTMLSYKEGEIPMAKKVTNNHWMHNTNTNTYGFNLIYAGARQHNGSITWYNKENGRQLTINATDMTQLVNFHAFPTSDGGMSCLGDYPDSFEQSFGNGSFMWIPVRWCRQLTDTELGYKLYVNSGLTDIVKLGLSDTPPAGYTELDRGYLRGFYVQYILDNPNPRYTVSDLVNIGNNLPDVTHNGGKVSIIG